MENNKMIATVEGVSVFEGKFMTTITFTMLQLKDTTMEQDTYYMSVEFSGNRKLIDVRYEETTDVEILADRWISGFFGDYIYRVTKVFPEEVKENVKKETV